MSEDDPDAGPSREYGRLVLVLTAVTAVGLAALFVPVLTGGGSGGGPAGALVPQPPGATPPAGSGGGSLGGFGALNPGDSTDIGGNKSAYRNQEPSTHFVVESSEPGYWRTGSYATYTGEGWERNASVTPVDGPIPVDGPSRSTVSYSVELRRSATSLPTLYRPRRVELAITGTVELGVTDGRAIRTGERVPFSTRYEATSARPVRDPEVLRAAGRDYPDAIAERYTQLPEDTRRELAPFVERLAEEEGAENPYETAKVVESWIRTEKEYSLEVPPPGEDVATEFVLDMEKGYCEYAATGMVAMLRSQDIPARYVVGYSTGRQVGPNRYQVLSMNAHAWVEVYFPDVGWVRFDPTPPDDRLAAEERAFENQTNQEYQPSTTPSPTPTPTPTPDSPTPSPTPPDDGPSPYRVSFNRTLAPGATVEATVTRGGTPQAGVTVLFNGRAIGETDFEGTVVGEVPYERNVTVRIREDGTPVGSLDAPPPVRALGATSPDRSLRDPASERWVGAPPPDRSRFPSVGPPPSVDGLVGSATTSAPTRATAPAPRTQAEDNGSVAGTFELTTDGNLSLSGEVVTGGEVVVTATVGGVPIRDAPVRVDGEQVARTNRRGQATVALPTAPGNTTLLVSRGAVTARRNVTLPELQVSVRTGLALPGFPAEATVRLGNRTAGNATVRAGGERVGAVGPNGTVSFGLPIALSPTVTASGYGQTATATVGGVGTNLAGVALGLALAVGAAVVLSRRTDEDLRSLLARALALLARLPDLLTALVVRFAEGVERLARELVSLPGRALALVRDLLAGRRTPGELLAAARAALLARVAAVRGWLADARDRSERAIATVADDQPEVTLGEAWRRFLSLLSVREADARTPGELARHAVERDGLPQDAVRTLRDDYRAVEYGARDPATRLERVEAALDEVERAVESGDEGDPTGGEER